MSDSEADSDSFNKIPDDIREAAKTIQLNSLPEKSKMRYVATFNKYKKWCKEKKTFEFSEDALLVYLDELKCSPNTLWATFSMIKACSLAFKNVNMSSYKKVFAYIKKKNVGYKPKKSKVFTVENISRLCNENQDPDWLVIKVFDFSLVS